MRILLINCPSKQKFVKEGRCQHKAGVFGTVYPPLTLVSMATILKKRHSVWVIDAEIGNVKEKDVLKDIKNKGFELIIVNVSSPTAEKDISFIKKLREIGYSKSIGALGIHATFFAREFLEHTPVDFVILGEGETFALSLSEARQLSLKDALGVAYRDKKGVKFNANPKPDVDALPIPDWCLIDYKKYRIPLFDKPYVIVQIGRGCPYKCVFCIAPYHYGSKVRSKSVKKIIIEIENGLSLGVRDFFFFQETFNIDNGLIQELCRVIIKKRLNIRWFANSRADLIDDETLRLMKKAGCWMVSLGIESLDQRVLNNARKGCTIQKLKEGINKINRAGILAMGQFIIGLPGDTLATMKKTVLLSKRIGLDFAVFYNATPFPGTELYSQKYDRFYKKKGWDQSLEYSEISMKGGIDTNKIVKAAWISFYARPALVIRLARKLGFWTLLRAAWSIIKLR